MGDMGDEILKTIFKAVLLIVIAGILLATAIRFIFF